LLATSEFVTSMFLILVVTPFILLWAAAVVDVMRRHYTGWAIVGWLLLILALPIVGPMIYFALRKPTSDEVEQSYLATRELERVSAARPVGGLGTGP
jgi:hypothetical protein